MRRDPLPVTVVTGFLGAGKTTLLRHLLQSAQGIRLGVVVNDFGALGIDAALIDEVRGDTQTVRLTNGCICCTVRDDLLSSVVRLSSTADPPDRVIVETSGVSDPEPVAAAFSLLEVAHLVRLDAVIAVVDAAGFPAPCEATAPLACAQIQGADLVLINKTDLVPTGRIAALQREVAGIAPAARSLTCSHGAVSPDVLLDAGTGGGHGPQWPAMASGMRPAIRHDAQFEAIDWRCDAPLDAERLQDALAGMPGQVLRGKGFVRTLQAPDEQGVLQMVGRRAALTRGQPWRTEPRTELVFVALRAEGNRAAVRAILDGVAAGSRAARS